MKAERDRVVRERRRRWERIFRIGRKAASEKGLTEKDVEKEIAAYRKQGDAGR